MWWMEKMSQWNTDARHWVTRPSWWQLPDHCWPHIQTFGHCHRPVLPTPPQTCCKGKSKRLQLKLTLWQWCDNLHTNIADLMYCKGWNITIYILELLLTPHLSTGSLTLLHHIRWTSIFFNSVLKRDNLLIYIYTALSDYYFFYIPGTQK